MLKAQLLVRSEDCSSCGGILDSPTAPRLRLRISQLSHGPFTYCYTRSQQGASISTQLMFHTGARKKGWPTQHGDTVSREERHKMAHQPYEAVPNEGGGNREVTEQIKGSVDAVSDWLEVHEVGKVSQEAIQSVLEKYKGFVSDGPFSFRVACFMAGTAMVFFGIVGIFLEGGIMNTLINFYQLGLGLLTIGLESSKPFLDPSFKAFLFEYFRFLFTLDGRGMFYILVGILIMSAAPIFNFFVGIGVMGTGIASLYYGRRARQKLTALKFVVTDEMAARQKFAEVDTDGDQKISIVQFSQLLEELNMHLDHHELEAAVAIIGNDMERTITSDSFCDWYNDQVLSGNVSADPESP